ncbi:TPA: helix-turn-helix transcriptional regulator [Burkholderia stabilis]|nr:helix-turn-helix transcriptional regulator [Burkholderia stabilis]HDR9589143.1 helix-turn-helix transcriptional regulator [Burkholderia stabilis]HDR9649539.1 helix-turn-helix transcriptional regulator [Burkholderia stabilis]HDR9653605.1 helix-turn-helix transcriptional regulator [Burkholderia stabilis]HDR9656300.1 helix-turn-helix transcriptional regulator [Burkholderia stabilis]
MSFEIDLEAIGRRIESLRGNLSQADFAAKLGVDRKTVGTWERGERLPDTRALVGLWREFDSDPAWVLTGGGFAPATTGDERELLALYRSASLTGKMAAVGALQGAAEASIGNRGRSNTGNQMGGRDIVGDGNVQVGHVGGNVRNRVNK